MMIVPFVFWLLLIAALVISWQAGDQQDRKVILAIFAVAVITAVSDLLLGGRASLIIVGLADLTLLAIVVRYALVSERHWPIWFAGVHAASVVFGVAALLVAVNQRMMLDLVSGFWAIPALFLMAAGLLADKRTGVANASR